MTGMSELSSRYRLATYWWLASELVRRHPKLNIVETYPLDGFYDCISVAGNIGGRDVLVEMNRLGSIHVHPEHIGLMGAQDVLASEEPLRALKTIEAAAGLADGKSGPSGTRLIALRLIARTLAFVLHDAAHWDVRMITPDGYGHSTSLFEPDPGGPEKAPLSSVFPTAALHHSFVVSSALDEDTRGRLWGLQKDGLIVAIFDTRGFVYTREQRVSIKPLYTRLGRSLTLTAVHALGNVLP